MTRSSDPRRKLDSDERIALLVAFLGIGSIIFWGLRQSGTRFDFSNLSKTLFSTSNTVQAPTPSLFNVPKPEATVGVAPTNAAPRNQQPAIQASPSIAPSIEQPNQQKAVPQPPQDATVPADPNLPNLVPAPVTPSAPTAIQFSDVPSSYWAGAYIAELSRRNILEGFSDGSFQPDQPITRAQFASLLNKAFDKPKTRPTSAFRDVEPEYWAKRTIDESVQTGFLAGYPNGVFQPNQHISVVQLQTALVTGLNLQPQTPVSQTLAPFEDANQVPKWAQPKVAAAIESGLISGFPTPQKLTPNRVATRADAAALIYQALVKEGRVTPTR